MTSLRPIRPLVLPAEQPRADPATYGRKPKWVWVDPETLIVDDTYQRDLTRHSMKVILNGVAQFNWADYSPPNCVIVDGVYHVIDGQHTAIICATLGIKSIPIVEVEANTVAKRARAFVGHNQNRVTMSPINIFRGLCGAGDKDATMVDRVMRQAGVRFRALTLYITPKVGDTGAIGVIRQLVKRRGDTIGLRVLSILVTGERAPITASEIQAVEAVICGDDPPNDGRLADAIKGLGTDGFLRLQLKARTEAMPVKDVLADEYRARARRKAA